MKIIQQPDDAEDNPVDRFLESATVGPQPEGVRVVVMTADVGT